VSSALFTETVTLRTRKKVGRDALNVDLYEWVDTPSPAWVEIGQGTENTDHRESSEATSTVYLPLEAPVAAVSELTWNGQKWQVVGDPGVQPGGFVVDGYQKLGIKRVTG
jgi:hypothetical protein